jgi:hypothetical protein
MASAGNKGRPAMDLDHGGLPELLERKNKGA